MSNTIKIKMSLTTARLSAKLTTLQLRCLSIPSPFLSTSVAKFSTKSDDFQYLQKSPIKTDFFQRSLPRLPIPKLKKTCERYLETQRALLNDEQFKSTEALVKAFLTFHLGLYYKTFLDRCYHRHLRKIDWAMAHTACLVCLVCTVKAGLHNVNYHSKLVHFYTQKIFSMFKKAIG